MPSSTTDSLKILLPSDAVEPGFRFYRSSSRSKQSRTPGLQSISFELGDRRAAVVEVSSKILPSSELIHRGNIGEVFERVNGSGLITIRPDALEQAYCLTVDPATDVIIAGSERLLKVINVLAQHPSYRKQDHKRTNNTTFYYTGSKKGKYAGKAMVYDKFAEDKDGYFAPDTIRFELSCPTGQAIQHRYGVGANRQGRILLKDVLESTANPVADNFEQILGSLYTAKDVAPMQIVRSGAGVNKDKVFRLSLGTPKEMHLFNMLLTQGFDLEEVYRTLKPTFKNRRPGKKAVLAPYAGMLQRYSSYDEELTLDYEVLMTLRDLLRNQGLNQSQEEAFAIAA